MIAKWHLKSAKLCGVHYYDASGQVPWNVVPNWLVLVFLCCHHPQPYSGEDDRSKLVPLSPRNRCRYGASLGGTLCYINIPTLLRLFSIFVYIRQVTTIRQDGTKRSNNTTNNITIVVELLAPPAVGIWWIHAAGGAGSLLHDFSNVAIEAI